MGWVVAPTIPGFEYLTSNWTWEGPVPDVLPEPPSSAPGAAVPVPAAAVLAPSLSGTMAVPSAVPSAVPAEAQVAPGLIPGLQAAYYAAHPEDLGVPAIEAPSTAAAGKGAAEGMLLLLGLAALAVNRMKGLKL